MSKANGEIILQLCWIPPKVVLDFLMLIYETPKIDSTICNISKSKMDLETKGAILFFNFYFNLLLFIFKMIIVNTIIESKKKKIKPISLLSLRWKNSNLKMCLAQSVNIKNVLLLIIYINWIYILLFWKYNLKLFLQKNK